MSSNSENPSEGGNSRSGRDRRQKSRSAADRRRLRNRIGGALLAIVVAGVATVYGCNSDRIAGPAAAPTSAIPSRPNADLGLPAPTEFPFEWEETNCNGEVIPMHGKVRFDEFSTNGGTDHLFFKMHYVVDATGTLGNVYHGASEYDSEVNTSVTGGEATYNHQVTLNSSTAPDYRVHIVTHVVYKPGGVTASFDKGDPDPCN
jgi:hypothetical protein